MLFRSLRTAAREVGTVVLVASRKREKGAVLLLPGESPGAPQKLPLLESIERLHPTDAVDVLCMQERCFGDRGLPEPAELPE